MLKRSPPFFSTEPIVSMLDIALLTMCAPDVAPLTMQAIVKHESGFNPFAIGINPPHPRLKKQPSSLAEAVRIANDLIARKIDFDAGLGQINYRNWKWLGLTSESVFNQCTNLRSAQRVLADCYTRAYKQANDQRTALLQAFSCYNTGNFKRGFDNGYVDKVLKSAGISSDLIARHR